MRNLRQTRHLALDGILSWSDEIDPKVQKY
jgi:hypothetical protein